MMLRLCSAALVSLFTFVVCYTIWLWALSTLIPSGFGMPDYEHEVEFAMVAGSIAFGIVPIWISVRICRRLRQPLDTRAPTHAAAARGPTLR